MNTTAPWFFRAISRKSSPRAGGAALDLVPQ
jgi:hypothetical protein